MNAFERKMAEQLALITTMMLNINRANPGFVVELEFDGRTQGLIVRFNEATKKPYPKMLGSVPVYYILRLETYLEEDQQKQPHPNCCTIEFIADMLRLTQQSIINGRIANMSDKALDAITKNLKRINRDIKHIKTVRPSCVH